MMKFREVKDNIINILGSEEAGRYQTIGFQRQVKSADEVLDASRMIQVYYDSGAFDKSAGSINGPVSHDITYKIALTIAKSSGGDLSIINDPSSTATDISNAISAFQEASQRCDDSFDELVDIVYQILMDARNYDLGFAKGVISNKWVDQVQKETPMPQGEFVVLTGSMILTCRVSEELTGDDGTPGDKVFDTTIDIDGDSIEKTGVTV